MTQIIDAISKNEKALKQNRYHWLAYGTPILAIGSGILYWLSANGAKERYGILAETLLPFCATVINTLFNEECYLSMTALDDPEYNLLIESFKSTDNKRAILLYDIITGFCTMAPACYISLPNRTLFEKDPSAFYTQYIVALISGLLNWPIYSASSHALVMWCKEHYILSRFFDNTINRCKNPRKANSNRITRRIKDDLSTALSNVEHHFKSLTSKDRQELLEQSKTYCHSSDNDLTQSSTSNWFNWIKETSKNYKRHNSFGIHKNRFISILHGLLFFTAVIQIAGYVVEAFNSGDLIEQQFTPNPNHIPGIGIASISFITQLGFSVMLLEELRDTSNMLRYAEGPIEQKLMPNFFSKAFTLIGSLAILSGTGSDVAGYNGFIQVVNPHCMTNTSSSVDTHNSTSEIPSTTKACQEVKLAAQAWAIGANLGAAIPYNFLMCVLLIKRGIEYKIQSGTNEENKKTLRFSKNIKILKDIVCDMPNDTFETIHSRIMDQGI